MDFRDVPRIPDQSSRRWPRTGAGRGQPMLDRKLSSLRSDRPQLYDEGVNPLRAHRFEGGACGASGRTGIGSISMPMLHALWPSCATKGSAKGSVSLASTATRRTEG